ncbi:hypothetical protein SARC_06524, partial [Sphaeroforma arctica JP610]
AFSDDKGTRKRSVFINTVLKFVSTASVVQQTRAERLARQLLEVKAEGNGTGQPDTHVPVQILPRIKIDDGLKDRLRSCTGNETTKLIKHQEKVCMDWYMQSE